MLFRSFGVGGTNTGFLYSGASSTFLSTYGAYPLIFGINNSEQMRLTSTGLGIGTSSPAYKLDIAGTTKLGSTNAAILAGVGVAFVGGQGELVATSNNSMGIGVVGAGNVNFYTNSLERMRLDSSGNFGIGATADASAILDAQSTTKGVRFPNMTTTQKNAIASPAAGLVVFDTTLAKLCLYTGAAWQTITSV